MWLRWYMKVWIYMYRGGYMSEFIKLMLIGVLDGLEKGVFLVVELI